MTENIKSWSRVLVLIPVHVVLHYLGQGGGSLQVKTTTTRGDIDIQLMVRTIQATIIIIIVF